MGRDEVREVSSGQIIQDVAVHREEPPDRTSEKGLDKPVIPGLIHPSGKYWHSA